jgi:hypothetical protein
MKSVILSLTLATAYAGISSLSCALSDTAGPDTLDWSVEYSSSTGELKTCVQAVAGSDAICSTVPAKEAYDATTCADITPSLETSDLYKCYCSDAVCFPGSSTVQLENGAEKTMAELQVGDKVLVANGEYAEVFMFTHVEKTSRAEFVEITTDAGAVLSISAGHLVHVGAEKALRAAGTVVAGDTVHLADGSEAAVTGVAKAIKAGIFAPQTMTGEIVVDGVLASCFTDYSSVAIQSAMLAPVRAMYELKGAWWFGANTNVGVPAFLRNTALALQKYLLTCWT